MALVKCKECKKEISSLAPACPSCGAPLADASGKHALSTKTVVVYKTASNGGVTTGILGGVFAILGIFTFGLLFLPFAALFSIFSLLGSTYRPNALGMLMALTSCILTITGIVMSPTAWIAFLALLGSRQ